MKYPPPFLAMLVAVSTLLCSAGSVVAAADAAPARRPNIIMLLIDDMGWGDFSCFGNKDAQTPHIDRLAAEGLRFEQFYVASPICSPSRVGLSTGQYPQRWRITSFLNNRAENNARGMAQWLDPQAPMLARMLHDAGYATGHFGKWHLNGKNGDRNTTALPGRAILANDPLSPGKLGFDEWVSADNFFDLDPVLGRNGVPEKFQGDSSDVTTDEALKFIRRRAAAAQPFLAVVWFGSPHVPHQALPADKAAYGALPEADQNYYGELTAVDRSVGRLRAALRELRIADNTLLWYNSDNGGNAGPKSTGNLRGSKGTLWEGGLRVPGLVEWPARIPRPFVSEMPCSTLDIYPTVLAATGAVAQNQILPLDGINLLPHFDRQTETRTQALPFWNHAGAQPGHAAWLEWPYKLHTHPVAARGAKKSKPAGEPTPAVQLYDVSKDPKETTDLAAQEPARVARMTAALAAWQASVEKSLAGADYPAAAR